MYNVLFIYYYYFPLYYLFLNEEDISQVAPYAVIQWGDLTRH